MGQAGVSACPIMLPLRLVVELQTKLDISRRLGGLDHTGCARLYGGVRHRKVHVVKSVQEVGSELQPESFRDREVFLQASIPVVKSGSAQSVKLRRAGSKIRGVGIVARIEILETTTLRCRSIAAAEDSIRAVAVWTQSARARPGLVLTVVVKGQRK